MRAPAFHLHQPKNTKSVLVCPFSYDSHSVFLLSPSTDTILAHAIIILFHKFSKSLLLVTGYFSYPPPQSALLFLKLYYAYTSPGDLVKDRCWLRRSGVGPESFHFWHAPSDDHVPGSWTPWWDKCRISQDPSESERISRHVFPQQLRECSLGSGKKACLVLDVPHSQHKPSIIRVE